MQSTSSETQVTQSGQAIAINNICCAQLSDLFGSMLGPNGSMKALVSGGQQLSLTKDGYSVCKDIQFTHPTSILITKTAASLYDSCGDGTKTFILLTCECFKEAYKSYSEGASIPLIINSLQLALKDINEFLQRNVVKLTDKTLRQLAYTSLNTKIKNPEFLVDIVMNALMRLNKNFDVNMIEIMKMEEGDLKDSIFVDGLVLDHGSRHHSMPTSLENVCVLTTNISLEYEKPEINAEFCYSSPQQRELLVSTERDFISQKAKKIAELACSLKAEGKSLLVINEKGIDQHSLEILSDVGVLALRRAKRRNLERLISMCGGKLVSDVSQVTKESLGFCQKVSVKSINENKYTFVEGPALKGACTILLRGDVDYDRINKCIRGTLNSLTNAIKTNYCIYGGIPLYRNMVNMLNEKAMSVHEADVVGYKIVAAGFENLIKVLLKNADESVQESFIRVFRETGVNENIVENIKVLGECITNSIVMNISLLMCDEIILAGRSINQSNTQNNQ